MFWFCAGFVAAGKGVRSTCEQVHAWSLEFAIPFTSHAVQHRAQHFARTLIWSCQAVEEKVGDLCFKSIGIRMQSFLPSHLTPYHYHRLCGWHLNPFPRPLWRLLALYLGVQVIICDEILVDWEPSPNSLVHTWNMSVCILLLWTDRHGTKSVPCSHLWMETWPSKLEP